MSAPRPLAEVLAALRDRFRASAGTTVATFTQLADRLDREPTAEVLDALRMALHRVHGTAGSYGFLQASRLAAAMEQVALRWAADEDLDRERRAEVIRRFSRTLGALLTVTSGEPPGASRLLLIGLADEVAVPLVSEAIHQGHIVERASTEQLAGLLDGAEPRAIIADARVAVAAPAGVPVILLHTAGDPIAPHDARARVLDAGIPPREVLTQAG